MTSTTRRPGQRAGLDHSAVLAAARELLAQHGGEAVTIRALARRLHVAPNTLYSHVASRTALLDELLDELLAGVEAPAADVADPLAGLHALMASTYDVLTAAPDLVPLYLARQGARGPHAVRLGEITDGLLVRAGVDPQVLPIARRVLIVHAIGSAAFATGTAPVPSTTEPVGADRPISRPESRDNFQVAGIGRSDR
jgi:AcrR family transcriptional regulator